MIDSDIVHKTAGAFKETIEHMGGKNVVIIYGYAEGRELNYGSQSDSALNVIGICRLMERLEIEDLEDNKKPQERNGLNLAI